MASVTGVTAEKALAIEANSVVGAHFDGSNLVLDKPGGVTVDVGAIPGGAGGGPVGISRLNNPVLTQSPSYDASYMNCAFDEFAEQSLSGVSLGVTSPAGSQCWAYANAGWYQVVFKLWLGFTVGAESLPSRAYFRWSSWEGADVSVDIPLTAPDTGSSFFENRSLYGAQFVVTTPVYYSPGDTEASAVDGSNSISLQWRGDAVLSNGNGGPANVIVPIVTRIA